MNAIINVIHNSKRIDYYFLEYIITSLLYPLSLTYSFSTFKTKKMIAKINTTSKMSFMSYVLLCFSFQGVDTFAGVPVDCRY